MPRIEDLQPQIGSPGPVDTAPARPNQAFADLGRTAAGLEGVLEQAADHDAALEGASALADFRAKRAQRQIELRTQATDPATFAETALADFDEEADKLITGHENERVQLFLEQRLVDARAGEEIDSATWAANTIVDRRARKTVDTVNKYANIVNSSPGQFQSALDDVDAMIDAAGLPLDVADRQKSTARSALARSAVYGQMETNPGGVLKQLQGGQWDDYLDNDVKISAVNAAQGLIERRISEARQLAAAQSSAAVADLSVRINQFANGQTDDVSQQDIDALKGSLSPSAWATQQKAFDDARAKRAKDDSTRVEVATMIEAGISIDPRNTDQTKALDQHFTRSVLPEIEATVSSLPRDQQASAGEARVLSFIQQQGIVPDTVKSSIRARLRGGGPDERAAAAAMLEQIKIVAPSTMTDFDADTMRAANTINAYVDAGMPAAEAVRVADEALRRPKIVDDALNATYDVLVKESPTDAWLGQALDDSWWSSTPSVPPEITAEVGALARSEFQRNGGNLDGARRTALDLAKKRYGPSTVNGDLKVMRNPPEDHYGVAWLSREENARAIRQEAVADLSQGGMTDWSQMPDMGRRAMALLSVAVGSVGTLPAAVADLKQSAGATVALTPDKVRIFPYAVRGVTGPDGRPVYALQVQDRSGAWSVQMDLDEKSPTFGLPKPWVPSMATPKAARDAEVQGAVAEAKGEVPPGAIVEGTQVYEQPPGKPKRLIGTTATGKFRRLVPGYDKP